MKFIFFALPTLPATLAERKTLRPIAHHTERWQQMITEVGEIAHMVEDLGFWGFTFPEHHLHTEGLEMGSLPVLQQHVITQTNHIKVGPIGYVLAGWNPLRLALEIAWLDQLTKGRILVGFARGYQTRWLNQMAQKLHVGGTISDKSETDRTNREAFEEVFAFLKLAWKDEPFRFKGKYYEYPYPYEEGTPWLAHKWTREYGAPGEVDDNGRVQMIDVVPKPYQKPHPPLFQAFSVSEETMYWCARESVIPTVFVSQPEIARRMAEVYREEARRCGRSLALGQELGVIRAVYPAATRQHAQALSEQGAAGVAFPYFFHNFGFTEAFRTPEDEARYGKQMLPPEECTADRLAQAHWALRGTVDDIRRQMDALVENVNPEYFIWQGDQGLLPFDEVKRQIELFGTKILPHYV